MKDVGRGRQDGNKNEKNLFWFIFSATNSGLCQWRKKFAFLRRRFIPSQVDCVSESFHWVESRYATRDCSRATEIYGTDTACNIHANLHSAINNDKKTCFNGIPVSEIIIFFRLREMRSCCSINLHLQFHLCRVFNEKHRDCRATRLMKKQKAIPSRNRYSSWVLRRRRRKLIRRSFYVLHVYWLKLKSENELYIFTECTGRTVSEGASLSFRSVSRGAG